MRDMEFFQKRFHPVFAFRRGKRCRFENRHQVFFHREPTENRRLLRQIADSHSRPLMHRKPADFLVADIDFPGVRMLEPDNHVKRRCLSRAVRSEQPDNLSRLHPQ